MKVLITVMPQISHLMLAKSFGKSLANAGAEVALASAPGMDNFIKKSDPIEFIPCGAESDGSLTFGKNWLSKGLVDMKGRDPGLWVCAERPMEMFFDDLCKYFDKNGKPDAVFRFPFELAGHFYSEVSDAKEYEVEFTIPFPRQNQQANWLEGCNQFRKKYNLEKDTNLEKLLDTVKIRFLPPLWYKDSGDSNALYIDLTHDDKIVQTESFDIKSILSNNLPNIVCGFGTFMENREEHFSLVTKAKDKMSRPCRLIVTTGPNVAIDKIYQGDDTIIRTFIPHSEILPMADAFISHGGFGSVVKALESQCPHLIQVKDTFDGEYNGNRIQDLGAGLVVEKDCTIESLAAKMDEIISSPKEAYKGLKTLKVEMDRCLKTPEFLNTLSQQSNYLKAV